MYTFIYNALYIRVTKHTKIRMYLNLEIQADSFRDAWMKVEMEHRLYAPEYKRLKGTLEPA